MNHLSPIWNGATQAARFGTLAFAAGHAGCDSFVSNAIKADGGVGGRESPPGRRRPGALEGVRRAFDPREWKWRILERGHARPGRIYRSSAEAEKRVSDTELMLFIRRCPFEALLELESGIRKNREQGKAEEKYPMAVEQNESLKDRALSWMDANYLGGRVFLRLTESPPVLVTFVSAPSSMLNGAYHIGTNCIHTDYALFTDAEHTGTRTLMILHELHHYAAWLGGGMGIRWRDEDGRPFFRKRKQHWRGRDVKHEALNETLTKTLSHQLALEKGVEVRAPSSAQSVLFGLMLQEIAGRGALRAAYLSGDFSAVMQGIEKKLGKGTFARIMENFEGERELFGQALELIVGLIRERRVEIGRFWEHGLGKMIFEEGDRFQRFIP